MARDGWMFVGPAALIALVGGALLSRGSTWGWVPLVVGLAAVGAFAFFFRDPDRSAPDDPGAVVATADGRILSVVDLPDGGLQIDTFLSVLNVHVNRAPVGGTVTVSRHTKGEYRVAYAPDAGHINERHDLVIESPLGLIRSAQIAGVLARRIVCRPRTGDRLHAGERIGLIRFGSRAQIVTPPGFVAGVKAGDRVRAGETILARKAQTADLKA